MKITKRRGPRLINLGFPKCKNEFVFRFSYFTFENEKGIRYPFFVRKFENEKGKNGIYTDPYSSVAIN